MVKVEDLFGGALVGAVVAELFRCAKATYDEATTFNNRVKDINENLEELTEELHKLNTLNIERGAAKAKAQSLINEAEPFVEECSTVGPMNLYKIKCYSSKLDDLGRSISKSVGIIKEENILRLMTALGESIAGPYAAVDPPMITVGLDDPSKDIKTDLWKTGMQVIVVSAPAGFGKTTLARKLCKDNEIKAKFKSNIFEVEFGEKPLKDILRRILGIFNYKTHRLFDFQTDGDAINRLEELLKIIENQPRLLFFDDVRSNSDPVLETFENSQLPDCKILVTSRYKLPRFGSRHNLKPLNEGDAMELFRKLAIIPATSSYKPDEETVSKIVKACKGSPLALTVVSKKFREDPERTLEIRVKEWTQGETIFHSNVDILIRLQSDLDVLEHGVKECFMDLGSFPEDQMIPATALIDMWRESYKLDDLDVIVNLYELSNQSLINLVVPRKNTSDDGCYNDYAVQQHDLLRELIIHLNKLEPIEKRQRIFIEIKGNDFDGKWLEQRQQPVEARLMSISTDEKFSSSWLDMEAPEVDVLILNLRSVKYTLPNFMKKMKNMKVLIVTNNGSSHAELNKFQLLGSLPDLKRIRLENVSIHCFGMTTMKMKNLQKISLVRCNTGQIFRNSSFQISRTCPNLKEVSIDYCNDLMELPDGLCDVVSITKLSITNCPTLVALPKAICKLEELQVLRLAFCTNLVEMPDTIGNLSKLNSLDISECVNIKAFMTVQIGKLSSLRTLCMKGCVNCRLPTTTTNLQNLEVVKCDNKTAHNWMSFKSNLSNLRIEVVEEDTNT